MVVLACSRAHLCMQRLQLAGGAEGALGRRAAGRAVPALRQVVRDRARREQALQRRIGEAAAKHKRIF